MCNKVATEETETRFREGRRTMVGLTGVGRGAGWRLEKHQWDEHRYRTRRCNGTSSRRS
jgi:hypothetical protein